jgi:hypothetical protein
MVQIILGDSHSFSLAHELKHAYQFEIGEFSLGKYPLSKGIYDITDEREAYARGRIFGGDEINESSELYKKLPKTQRGISFLLQLTKNKELHEYAISNNIVFRINGITYNEQGKW